MNARQRRKTRRNRARKERKWAPVADMLRKLPLLDRNAPNLCEPEFIDVR